MDLQFDDKTVELHHDALPSADERPFVEVVEALLLDGLVVVVDDDQLG